MATRSTAPRRCTPSFASADGISLVEVLVSLVLTLGVMAAGLTISLSARATMLTDSQRTAVNQNLRTGMDLLGLDIRQAGERLPNDVPVIEIVNGGSGVADTLVLRRNLLDVVLPLCADIAAGSSVSDVPIAVAVAPVPPGCAPVADSDADGWPDNLEVWRDHRLAAGGTVLAYLYDPSSREGEFFEYDSEAPVGLTLHRPGGGNWQNDYTVADQARLYILEQKAFTLDQDMLSCVLNDGEDTFNLVDHLRDFQVRVLFDDGSDATTLGPGDDLSRLQAIEVTLLGEANDGGHTLDRRLVASFLPRNLLPD